MQNPLTSVLSTESPTAAGTVAVIKLTGYCQLLLTVRNGRKYIFKCLRPELASAPQYQALLRKEFDIAITLDHANILRYLSYESLPEYGDGILMEWIDGMTLSDWLSTNPSPAERRRIALQLAEALEYAHAKGIAHRDLKPDNVMITHTRRDVKLIDFGLADADDYLFMKRSGATKAFGAPEQLDGTGSDTRSDIYSFGLILNMLSLPARYRRLARKCLSPDPARRPSMQYIVNRLSQLQSQRRSYRRILIPAAIAVIAVGTAVYLLTPAPPTSSTPSSAGSEIAGITDEDDPADLEDPGDIMNTFINMLSIIPTDQTDSPATEKATSPAVSSAPDKSEKDKEQIIELLKFIASFGSEIDSDD